MFSQEIEKSQLQSLRLGIEASKIAGVFSPALAFFEVMICRTLPIAFVLLRVRMSTERFARPVPKALRIEP
jgi:hypothetical protein